MQDRYEIKKKVRLFVLVTGFISVVFLAGCAQKGPLLIDFRYQAPQSPGLGKPKAVIAVAGFKDERGKTESVAGKRYLQLNDIANDLVVHGTVSGKVAAAVRNAFEARGIEVRDSAVWDLTDKGIPESGAGVLVGGEIKSLWVDSTSSLANTKIKADVQLRIFVADTLQRKIVRVLNVNSTLEREYVRFSTQQVEDTLSEALSAAMNQMFKDEELKKLLQ